ncbi:MAG TPA: DUF2332 family protein [Polyangiaceae bacterium]|jgi:hypothetical protein
MNDAARPTHGLGAALEAQRGFVAESVPVYARLLELLSEELERGLDVRLDAAWAGRRFFAGYDRPLLLLAALRASALREGPSHPLHAAVVGDAGPELLDAAALASALSDDYHDLWQTLRERSVQTNETTRAVAWLWPASLLGRAFSGLDLDLYDVGASAGLNLLGDRLPFIWQDELGAPLVGALPCVRSRLGYDASPLDASSEEARNWLRACVWPGQAARIERLEVAFAAWDSLAAAGAPPKVVRARASHVPDMLPRAGDCTACAYQTLMRDYLPPDEARAYSAGMRRWLHESTGLPLWVELENTLDGSPPETSTALVVHLAGHRDESLDFELARCHPHPSKLRVDRGALEALVRELERRAAKHAT